MKAYNYLLVLTLIFFFSCNKEKDDNITPEYLKKTNKMVNKWLGEKMILPIDNDIIFVNNPNKYKDLNQIIKINNSKIIVHIDASCSECVNAISYWEKFSKKVDFSKINCEIIMFITGNDLYNIEQLMEYLNVSSTCFYDKDALFKKNNGLEDRRFQAALINKHNKVVIIGNPVYNKALGDLYFDTLVNN